MLHLWYKYLNLSVLFRSAAMVLGDIGELLEMFKNSFPFSFLFFVPILIILSPVSPVSAAHEFAALRMQQYDLHGVSYGKYPTLIVKNNIIDINEQYILYID